MESKLKEAQAGSAAGRAGPVRVASVYVIAGLAWVSLSDWLLIRLIPDHIGFVQTAKGFTFVLLSGLLVYVLVRREFRARRRMEEEREQLQFKLAGSQRLEAIGRLTGGIAHDFNNLLTAIRGNIESYLVRSEDPAAPGPELEELHEAASAADRAADLIRQLLAVGRRQTLHPRDLDLNTVIEEMSRLLHRLIGDDIAIRTRLAPELWLVSVDPGPLQQVVMNLALNARDAMPEGGDLQLCTDNVALSTETTAAFSFPMRPGDYVRLQVRDTGIGMDAETRDHIYEPFFSTKPQDIGTGLGLATVFGIVKQSGGFIDVDSAPGRGTRFDVYLPRAAPGGAPRPAAPAAEARETRGTGTILVVEDDDAVRALVVRALRRSGYTTFQAPDAAEALDLVRARNGTLDLLVTDAIMPGIDGPQLIRAARSIRPGLRALLISGLQPGEIDDSTPYLAKPFTPLQLVARVHELLGKGQGARHTRD